MLVSAAHSYERQRDQVFESGQTQNRLPVSDSSQYLVCLRSSRAVVVSFARTFEPRVR